MQIMSPLCSVQDEEGAITVPGTKEEIIIVKTNSLGGEESFIEMQHGSSRDLVQGSSRIAQ